MGSSSTRPSSCSPPGVWEIDPAHTNVEFVARHLLSRVRGRFTRFEGAIVIPENPADAGVEVTIDAASIATGNDDRDAHLRSPDFLDVDRFPTLSFRSTGVRPGDEPGRFL
ncbi:MAG TPA: YceI family protein, partial [Acidimicrobiia bacterium]